MKTLKEIIEKSDNIVFFGGAGVSTESGIPDFRGSSGIYNQQYEVPAERILTYDYMMAYPEKFFEFFTTKMVFTSAKPNPAHFVLAELERRGKLKAVITQNIDCLHQMAGSKNVIELHGNICDNYCIRCNKKYDLDYVLKNKPVPRCDCGGIVRPDVVLYGEPLREENISAAIDYISKADVLIVGGTSLVVYPAAGLIRFFSGSSLVIINKDATSYDIRADLVIRDSIGKVFKELDII